VTSPPRRSVCPAANALIATPARARTPRHRTPERSHSQRRSKPLALAIRRISRPTHAEVPGDNPTAAAQLQDLYKLASPSTPSRSRWKRSPRPDSGGELQGQCQAGSPARKPGRVKTPGRAQRHGQQRKERNADSQPALDWCVHFLASAGPNGLTLPPWSFAALNPGVGDRFPRDRDGGAGVASLSQSWSWPRRRWGFCRPNSAVCWSSRIRGWQAQAAVERRCRNGDRFGGADARGERARSRSRRSCPFAAGHTPANAAVTVTQGALNR